MRPKSLYISCLVSIFYGAEKEIQAGFGLLVKIEKNILSRLRKVFWKLVFIVSFTFSYLITNEKKD